VRNLDVGTYDFIAAGSNGIAAVRFQAIDSGSVFDQKSGSVFQPVAFRKTAAVAAAASLQVCLTCDSDSSFVGEQIDYAANNAVIAESVPCESCNASPIEYASESLGCGCAAGGSCGSCGSFPGASAGFGGGGAGGTLLGGGGAGGTLFGGGGAGGALFGGGGAGGALFGGGSRFGRIIGLGGLAGGIVALATDSDGSPAQATPSTTN